MSEADGRPLRVALLMDPDAFDPERVRDQLAGFDYEFWPDHKNWDEAEYLRRLRDVDAIVTHRASRKVPPGLAEERGRLRLLAHCAGTVRHLVDRRHIEGGLLVTNWGDRVFGVAEASLALLLACLKQIPAIHRHVSSDWQDDRRIHQGFPCTLADMDVGLYGFGPIGRHMAQLLEPFGTRVAIYDPYAEDVPSGIRVCGELRELFATCQAISLHCGLNDATRDSVTAELLALLPQGGILVNTARGPIVDEGALAREVANRRLLCAVDVIRNEREWARSPLHGLDGAILTGHIIGGGKGYPPDRKPPRELPDFVVDNLRALVEEREPIHLIDAGIYDLKT